MEEKRVLGFIHPDLGIGGAERLILDAATELQRCGHKVHLYTAYHDLARCFEDTLHTGVFMIDSSFSCLFKACRW